MITKNSINKYAKRKPPMDMRKSKHNTGRPYYFYFNTERKQIYIVCVGYVIELAPMKRHCYSCLPVQTTIPQTCCAASSECVDVRDICLILDCCIYSDACPFYLMVIDLAKWLIAKLVG